MAMMKTKIVLIVAAVAAVLTLVLLQHRALERLRQENARLAAKLATRPEPAPAPSREPDSVESARLRAQESELLKLCAEVTRLRNQPPGRGAAAAQPAAATTASGSASLSPSDLQTNDFSAEVRTLVSFGQTVVTGGWTTAPGRRALAFLRPELKEEAGDQFILLQGQALEVSEAVFAKYNLQGVAGSANQIQQKGGLYANTEAEQLIQNILQEVGSGGFKTPPLKVRPGEPGNVRLGNANDYVMLSATPTLTPDGNGIDLQFKLQTRRPQTGP